MAAELSRFDGRRAAAGGWGVSGTGGGCRGLLELVEAEEAEMRGQG
jgi:hypothetical protein